jgi:hypothetical protein
MSIHSSYVPLDAVHKMYEAILKGGPIYGNGNVPLYFCGTCHGIFDRGDMILHNCCSHCYDKHVEDFSKNLSSILHLLIKNS